MMRDEGLSCFSGFNQEGDSGFNAERDCVALIHSHGCVLSLPVAGDWNWMIFKVRSTQTSLFSDLTPACEKSPECSPVHVLLYRHTCTNI